MRKTPNPKERFPDDIDLGPSTMASRHIAGAREGYEIAVYELVEPRDRLIQQAVNIIVKLPGHTEADTNAKRAFLAAAKEQGFEPTPDTEQR